LRRPRRVVEFHTGNPDLGSFPTGAWAQSLRRAASSARVRDLAYGRPEGASSFRRVLAEYLFRARGIECPPDRIVIVSGIAEGILLLTMALRESGACALIEDPCLQTVQRAFEHGGFALDPVRVDLAGLVTNALPARPTASLLYVAPAHQFPLGGVLSASRRLDLVAYARRHRLWILEDDYDAEFRYSGVPIPPLHSLAPERVVTFGSFSKVFFPALRLAYLALPERLAERVIALKRDLNLMAPTLEQIALAQWLEEGRLERHVHRMKRLYRRRRESLVAEVTRSFDDAVSLQGASGGLHLILELRGLSLRRDDASWLAEQGVEVDWAEDYAIVKGDHTHRLVLGYGSLPEDRMVEGLRRLHAALRTLKARHSR